MASTGSRGPTRLTYYLIVTVTLSASAFLLPLPSPQSRIHPRHSRDIAARHSRPLRRLYRVSPPRQEHARCRHGRFVFPAHRARARLCSSFVRSSITSLDGAYIGLYTAASHLCRSFISDMAVTKRGFRRSFQRGKDGDGRLHLVFDGGVHSHFAHLYARRQPACYGHTSTSLATGATAPLSAAGYLAAPLDSMKDDYRALAMVVGRCYAMDRDKRWERIKAGLVGFAHAAVNDADEFLMLTIVNGVEGRIKDDGTLFFDYRSGSDRMRELVSAVVHGYLFARILQECDCRAGQRDMQHGTSTDAAVVTVPVDVTVAADVALDLAQGAVDFIAHRYC
ncbi:BPG-independent [Mycena pura]|uniref:BPG-independent n=1 Tax=Mycena pura TaxID=153505 RepID=A0AAD6Y0K9_9AGAR|nr:BPG-independent [Mycena pura]